MKPSRLPAFFRRALMLAASATLASSPALAATWYWDTDAGTEGAQQASGTWTDGGSTWWDGAATVPWDNGAIPGNIAHFGTSAGAGPADADSRTVTIDGSVNAAGVIFNTSASGYGYILTGGTLVMADGSVIAVSGGTSTDTNRRHQIESSISGADINLERHTVEGNTNLAMLQLRGSNTWTGTLTLSSAETGGLFVEAYSGTVLNTLSTVSVGTSATLVLSAGDDFTTNFSITGTGAGGRGALRFDVNEGKISGNVLLTGNASIGTLNNTITGTISGTIGQSGGARTLTINSGSGNTGTIVLSGANTYTGRTTISNGILSVASINSVAGGTASSNLGAPTTVANGTIYLGSTTNTGQLLYTGSGETTDRVLNLAGTTGGGTVTQNGTGLLKFTGNVTATGAGIKTLNLQGSGEGEIAGVIANNSAVNTTGVTKAGTGTWTLSGANTYTGRTSISNGILSAASLNSVAGGTASSSLGAPTTIENGTIYLGSGTSTGQLLYTGNGETTDRVLNLAGTTGGGIITQNGTGLLKFTSNLTTTGNGSKTLTLQGTGEGEIAGIIVNSTSATGLAKSGTGTWTLSGANTYTGATTVNDGILRLAGAGLLSTGNLTMNGGQLDLNGTSQTVGNLTGGAGATIINDGAATHVTLTVGAGTSGTYAGTLADGAGTLALTKNGTSATTLSGANSYSGSTLVSAGALVVANDSALGTTDSGTTVSDGARLVLADGVTVTGEALSITGGGGNNNGALQAAANSTATWNGSITTSGSEARLGALLGGHLIINGNIDASQRSVIIRTTGDASTSGADFDNTAVTLGGTYTGTDLFLYQGVVKLGASNRISDSTLVTFGTSSTNIRQRFDLNGFNETIAGLAVSGSAASATHEVTNTAATSSTLTLDSATNRTFSGIVTGNLAIQKQGSNNVTFSGINTYTGDTNVNAGTFNVTGELNGGGSMIVAAGATFNLNSLGTFLFNIEDNGVNNSITGPGTANLNGILNFNLSLAARVDGNSWQLVDTSGSTSWTGVRVTSTSGDFTDDSGVWTLHDGDSTWSFDQETGVLSLVQVPEPGQVMLLLAGLAGCSLRRRRMA